MLAPDCRFPSTTKHSAGCGSTDGAAPSVDPSSSRAPPMRGGRGAPPSARRGRTLEGGGTARSAATFRWIISVSPPKLVLPAPGLFFDGVGWRTNASERRNGAAMRLNRKGSNTRCVRRRGVPCRSLTAPLPSALPALRTKPWAIPSIDPIAEVSRVAEVSGPSTTENAAWSGCGGRLRCAPAL